jgi:hypothetical protein
LNEIIGNPEITTQDLIDDLYTQVVAQFGATQSKRANKLKRARGPKNQTGSKTKQKRYIYCRMQDLFCKNPNILARYIREGTPWLEDECSGSTKPEDVKNFYTALWGQTPV